MLCAICPARDIQLMEDAPPSLPSQQSQAHISSHTAQQPGAQKNHPANKHYPCALSTALRYIA